MKKLLMLGFSLVLLFACTTTRKLNTEQNSHIIYNISESYFSDVAKWENVPEFYHFNDNKISKDYSGTSPNYVKIGLADNYIFVFWHFNDGKPVAESNYNYTVDFITKEIDGTEKYTNLKIGSNNSKYIAHIPYGPLDKENSKWITIWEGTGSDLKIGNDYLLARFQKSALLSKIKLSSEMSGGIGIYRNDEPTGFYYKPIEIMYNN